MIINYSARPSLVANRFGDIRLKSDGPNQLIHRGNHVSIVFETEPGTIHLEVDEEHLKESMSEARQLLREKKLPVSFDGQSMLTTDTLPLDTSLVESVGFHKTDKGVWEWKADSSPSHDDTMNS